MNEFSESKLARMSPVGGTPGYYSNLDVGAHEIN